jgi:DNA (cytosine-5)-methyltransferase 1
VDNKMSSRFVEWMMGLPVGWVTDLGLSRTQELKMLGNGVVPQQAAAAYGWLLKQ